MENHKFGCCLFNVNYFLAMKSRLVYLIFLTTLVCCIVLFAFFLEILDFAALTCLLFRSLGNHIQVFLPNTITFILLKESTIGTCQRFCPFHE